MTHVTMTDELTKSSETIHNKHLWVMRKGMEKKIVVGTGNGQERKFLVGGGRSRYIMITHGK